MPRRQRKPAQWSWQLTEKSPSRYHHGLSSLEAVSLDERLAQYDLKRVLGLCLELEMPESIRQLVAYLTGTAHECHLPVPGKMLA